MESQSQNPELILKTFTHVDTSAWWFNPLYASDPKSSLANNENQDEMPHHVAFHQGLHSLLI